MHLSGHLPANKRHILKGLKHLKSLKINFAWTEEPLPEIELPNMEWLEIYADVEDPIEYCKLIESAKNLTHLTTNDNTLVRSFRCYK